MFNSFSRKSFKLRNLGELKNTPCTARGFYFYLMCAEYTKSVIINVFVNRIRWAATLYPQFATDMSNNIFFWEIEIFAARHRSKITTRLAKRVSFNVYFTFKSPLGMSYLMCFSEDSVFFFADSQIVGRIVLYFV